jgi:hypothetical protein
VADIDPAGRETRLARADKSRRSSNRDSLFLSATIRRQGEAAEGQISARVRNLSAVGVMVDYLEEATPGEPVLVTVRGIGTVSGKVAWVKQDRIGIAFDDEVDPKLARKPITNDARPQSPERYWF